MKIKEETGKYKREKIERLSVSFLKNMWIKEHLPTKQNGGILFIKSKMTKNF